MSDNTRLDRAGHRRGNLVRTRRRCRGRGRRRARRLAGMGGPLGHLPDGDAAPLRQCRPCRAKTEFAELIARETGKPFWEAKTEVNSVIAKVEISINAYSERTPTNRLEAAMGNKVTVRHKPHGVLAVLGPYNFPAHLPNGHIVPALIAGNAVVFKPSEKTPATGAFLVECFHEAGVPEGVLRLLIGGPAEGKSLAGQAGIDGLLFTGSVGAGMALHRQFAENSEQDPGAGAGRQQPDRRVGRARPAGGGDDHRPVGLSCRPASAAPRRGG